MESPVARIEGVCLSGGCFCCSTCGTSTTSSSTDSCCSSSVASSQQQKSGHDLAAAFDAADAADAAGAAGADAGDVVVTAASRRLGIASRRRPKGFWRTTSGPCLTIGSGPLSASLPMSVLVAIALLRACLGEDAAAASDPSPPRSAATQFLDIARFAWGEPTVEDDGTVILSMRDKDHKGGGWVSREPFYHGVFKALVRVPATPCCGIVTALYLTSEWNSSWHRDLHDEVDFEILGDHNSGDVLLQTNYFLGGVGGHEERMRLWFDPTLDFHEYKFVVNSEAVRWFVDNILVREVTRDTHGGVLPTTSLFFYASLWDGSYWVPCNEGVANKWAAQVDLVSSEMGQFIAAFRNVSIDACYWRQMVTADAPECTQPNRWLVWNAELSPKDRVMLQYMQSHYRVFTWELFHPRGTGKWIVGREAEMQRVAQQIGDVVQGAWRGGSHQSEQEEKMLRGHNAEA